jgi:MFS family permease
MNKSSSFTALRNPAFRSLWIATVISGTCVAAHDSAATWMMNNLTGSPLLISLMSTMASVPFFLSDCLTILANLLLVLVYVLMALVRQTELFFMAAAAAGVGWTLSASELWVAAQRAIPNRLRGRMNAMVIMASQGAMALGGVVWGSTAAIAGTRFTLLGAAALFFMSLFLGRRLSINVPRDLEQTVSGLIPGSVEAMTPIGLTKELAAA